MMVTANKGDWAELYAFFKVISERNIPLADENLGPLGDSVITFQNVHRALQSGKIAVYHLSADNIVIRSDEFADIFVPVQHVASKTAGIFDRISVGEGAFELHEAHALMHILHLHTVKAPSHQKADLVATILDRNTGSSDLTGFSTKSFLGASATLLNAGPISTNFRFRVQGIGPDQMDGINAIQSKSKVRDRLAMITDFGGDLVFDSMLSDIFEANLRKIDTLMPEFVAHMLRAYFSGRGPSCTKLVADLAQNSPDVARYRLSPDDLTFKIKELLVNIALGLVPNTPWDGMQRVHGGI
jgi:hypothetical protein